MIYFNVGKQNDQRNLSFLYTKEPTSRIVNENLVNTLQSNNKNFVISFVIKNSI